MTGWDRLVGLAVVTALGCGRGGGAPSFTSIAISIDPPAATISVGSSQLFHATVTGASNPTVTWSVTGASTGGTISPDGLFTAPGTTGVFTVNAISVQDQTKSAAATITVVDAHIVSLSITPSNVSTAPNSAVQFSAIVSGATDATVLWSVLEGSQGGRIDANGRYSAQGTAGVFHVVATSHADATKTATALVSVTNTPQVMVSIDPVSAQLHFGATTRFTATVTGTSNSSVSWSTDGGGIDQSGLFTAPQVEGAFRVTVASQADATKSASAIVSVSKPPHRV